MNIIKPSHEIMLPESPYKHIERIGRICYRSEDAITETSAGPFVGRLFKSGHHAMIEHFRFIIEVDNISYNILRMNNYNKYMTFTYDNGRSIISVSARGLHDMYNMASKDGVHNIMNIIEDIVHLIIREYKCPTMFYEDFMRTYSENEGFNYRIIKDFSELSENEYKMHAWYTIRFVCDRGVTHEMVRHRDASFAQESTRYCNYSKGKYGSSITVIDPFFFDKDEKRINVEGSDFKVNKYDVWKTCMDNLEHAYMILIKLGATPQEARSILPNSLKTEIVITAQVYEWIHIFNLRVLGTTGAPHPQIKEVMEPAYNKMIENGYLR